MRKEDKRKKKEGQEEQISYKKQTERTEERNDERI